MKLTEHVIGLPEFHPLLNDADDLIQTIRTRLDRYASHLRLATAKEAQLFDCSSFDPFYVFAPPSLGKCATAEDVAAGNAIFHLENPGRLSVLSLPAVGILKGVQVKQDDDDDGQPVRVLIVQAEVAKGGMYYGIVERFGIRKIEGDKIEFISSLEDWKDE